MAQVGGKLQATSSVSAALALAREGFDNNQIADRLYNAGWVASPTAGLQAAGKARQSMAAANLLESQTSGRGVGAAQAAPIERQPQGGYSYVVDVEVTNPQTGVVSRRTVVVDSDVPLTAQQAQEQSADALVELRESGVITCTDVGEFTVPDVTGTVTAILRR